MKKGLVHDHQCIFGSERALLTLFLVEKIQCDLFSDSFPCSGLQNNNTDNPLTISDGCIVISSFNDLYHCMKDFCELSVV